MGRKRGGRFLIGAAVATGLATIVLALATLRGVQSPSSGELVVSAAIGTSLVPAILLAGSLAILSLELVHLMRRRQTRLALSRAAGRRSGGPVQKPADLSRRPHHSARDRPGRRPSRPGET